MKLKAIYQMMVIPSSNSILGDDILLVFQFEVLLERISIVEVEDAMTCQISDFVLELVFGEPDMHSLSFLNAFQCSFVNCPIIDNLLQSMDEKLCLVGSVGFVLFEFLGELSGH